MASLAIGDGVWMLMLAEVLEAGETGRPGLHLDRDVIRDVNAIGRGQQLLISGAVPEVVACGGASICLPSHKPRGASAPMLQVGGYLVA